METEGLTITDLDALGRFMHMLEKRDFGQGDPEPSRTVRLASLTGRSAKLTLETTTTDGGTPEGSIQTALWEQEVPLRKAIQSRHSKAIEDIYIGGPWQLVETETRKWSTTVTDRGDTMVKTQIEHQTTPCKTRTPRKARSAS